MDGKTLQISPNDLHTRLGTASSPVLVDVCHSDGWSNVQIVRDGRYFEAIASKDGSNSKVVVDSQTGRLRAGEDDDDD